MRYCVFCMNALTDNSDICHSCGHSQQAQTPVHHLNHGTMLQDRYLIGTALGEGGFGITYIARDVKLDRVIAVKEYYPNGYVNRNNTVSAAVSYSKNEDRQSFYTKGLERFLTEARILAKFSGMPGIVDVYDFFEENGTAYIVMEYLKGQTLNAYLKQVGKITPEKTVKLLVPVLRSLKTIHAQGLIHRDISPDNIMYAGDTVKLLDFGAARNMSAIANKSISMILKPGYSPEEQYRTKGNQGPWTDIYAMCATMYRCITGITPDDAPERLHFDEVKAPSVLGIRIAPNIESAIMKGLQVHQEQRYQTVDALMEVLMTPTSAEPVIKTKPVEIDKRQTMYLFPPESVGMSNPGNDNPAARIDPQRSETLPNNKQTVSSPAPSRPSAGHKNPYPAPQRSVQQMSQTGVSGNKSGNARNPTEICPACGALQFPGARFCSKCGSQMKAFGHDAQKQQTPYAAKPPVKPPQGSVPMAAPPPAIDNKPPINSFQPLFSQSKIHIMFQLVANGMLKTGYHFGGNDLEGYIEIVPSSFTLYKKSKAVSLAFGAIGSAIEGKGKPLETIQRASVASFQKLRNKHGAVLGYTMLLQDGRVFKMTFVTMKPYKDGDLHVSILDRFLTQKINGKVP